jgi:hypothetical protein
MTTTAQNIKKLRQDFMLADGATRTIFLDGTDSDKAAYASPGTTLCSTLVLLSDIFFSFSLTWAARHPQCPSSQSSTFDKYIPGFSYHLQLISSNSVSVSDEIENVVHDIVGTNLFARNYQDLAQGGGFGRFAVIKWGNCARHRWGFW